MELRMEALRTSREPWTQWFPVERNLLFGALQGPGEVLLVDVGGGGGEDITDFARQFPAAKGRLVLQDLPEVLGKSSIAEARIELLPHDFFNPQPIRG